MESSIAEFLWRQAACELLPTSSHGGDGPPCQESHSPRTGERPRTHTHRKTHTSTNTNTSTNAHTQTQRQTQKQTKPNAHPSTHTSIPINHTDPPRQPHAHTHTHTSTHTHPAAAQLLFLLKVRAEPPAAFPSLPSSCLLAGRHGPSNKRRIRS
jgi:hypothetical protein